MFTNRALRNVSKKSFLSFKRARFYHSSISEWASITDPTIMGDSQTPYHVPNLVNGKWISSGSKIMNIPNPISKSSHALFSIQDTQVDELKPFVDSLAKVPKGGLHNPLKNVDRYLELGDISRKAGQALLEPEISDFFTRSIMKCVPKSYSQAKGEVTVTAAFLNNFGGDNVRFLSRGFSVPGDHVGQQSNGYRWPYGPVAIIAPFNFPLEIPVLQLMGALYMGNKPVLKPAEKVSIVMEQFLRLLHHSGLPLKDVDFLNCQGQVASDLIAKSNIRLTQFTGSTHVAEMLSKQTNGKVKIEDAAFDWKILGPDVADVDYVSWQCDQDAYASSGQKCSAQSILFMHKNWNTSNLVKKIKKNASKRSLKDLTVGPVLTHTTQDILDHTSRLLSIPGSYLVCGGKELENHEIPEIYGAVEPTAVFVPLEEMMKIDHFNACVKEVFAPFQVITEYDDDSLDMVLDACERMSHHLTAAVVSNDIEFQQQVLGRTINGTTYVGRRARTTGAPQNHWFGPAGDVRGAGIGTPEAVKMVWSCHREIISDVSIPNNWVQPKPT